MFKELNFSEYSFDQMRNWLAVHHYTYDAEMMDWVAFEEDYYCICVWDGPDFYILYYGRDGKLNRVEMEH